MANDALRSAIAVTMLALAILRAVACQAGDETGVPPWPPIAADAGQPVSSTSAARATLGSDPRATNDRASSRLPARPKEMQNANFAQQPQAREEGRERWENDDRDESAEQARDDDDCGPPSTTRGPLLQRLFQSWQNGLAGPPVCRENWLRRPFSVTWLAGGMVGSPIVDDWLGESSGAVGALAFGWDFDPYWGAEARYSYSSVDLWDSQRAIGAQIYQDRGLAANDPLRNRFDGGRNGDIHLFTVNFLYYPRGDSPWRPYFLVGIGGTLVSFDDRLGYVYDEILPTMPFGVGWKYHWTDWMALRFELTDNLAFGKGPIETLHNVSIVGGLELRLGGARKSYFPYNPSRNYW